MSSSDEVILVSEPFLLNNKRARTEPTASTPITATGEFAADNLQCPICIDLLYDPCIVPCGHEFCRTCIEEVVRSTRHRGCPVCRSNFTAARLGVNRKLKTIIEQLYAKESARRAREVAEDQDRIRKEKAARDAREAGPPSLAARLAEHRAHHTSSFVRLTHMMDGLQALHSEALQGNRAQQGEGDGRGIRSAAGLPGDSELARDVAARMRERRLRLSERMHLSGAPGFGEAGGSSGRGAVPAVSTATSTAVAAGAAGDLRWFLAASARPGVAAEVQQQVRQHAHRMRQLSQQAGRIHQQTAAAAEQPQTSRPPQPLGAAAASYEAASQAAAMTAAAVAAAAAGPSSTAAASAVEPQPGCGRSAARLASGLDRGASSRPRPFQLYLPADLAIRGNGPTATASGTELAGPGSTAVQETARDAAVTAAAAASSRAGTSGGRGGAGQAGTSGAGVRNTAPGFRRQRFAWDDFGGPPWLEPPPPFPTSRPNAFTAHSRDFSMEDLAAAFSMAPCPPLLPPPAPLPALLEELAPVFRASSRDGQAAASPWLPASRAALEQLGGHLVSRTLLPRRARATRGPPAPGTAGSMGGGASAMATAALAALPDDPDMPDLLPLDSMDELPGNDSEALSRPLSEACEVWPGPPPRYPSVHDRRRQDREYELTMQTMQMVEQRQQQLQQRQQQMQQQTQQMQQETQDMWQEMQRQQQHGGPLHFANFLGDPEDEQEVEQEVYRSLVAASDPDLF